MFRALSIRQQWASAILLLGKNVENRSWSTAYRGLLLLHAAARLDPDSAAAIRAMGFAPLADVPLGAILGVAELVGICPASADWGWDCDCGPWALRGQYHWRLANVRAFTSPIPAKGSLGLWPPFGTVAAAVDRELADV